MGRDHTIYATECGYVKYYKDPERHPKRQYIGVTFERDMVLPLPRNSPRRRRLGMVATKMESAQLEVLPKLVRKAMLGSGESGEVLVKQSKSRLPKGSEGRNLQLRSGYMYRESNWEIGRAAERANIQVREFKPRDRWVAWRKASIRNKKITEKKGLGRRK
jgi:large subunit ribosomal protein L27